MLIKTLTMRISISIWLNVVKILLNPIPHYFLYLDYIMTLIPFDLLEVKWLNSHIFMSYMDARTEVKCNESMDTNFLDGEEENESSTFL